MMRYSIRQEEKEPNKPDPSNPVHKEVRTPKYRQRIEKDRTKYTRKKKRKGEPSDELPT